MARPSPHRFLSGRRRNPSPTKTDTASQAPVPSHKRPAADRQVTLEDSTPSSQFAPTPRFGKGRPQPQRPPSPSTPLLAQALRASVRSHDVVEDVPSRDHDEEMLDDEHAHAYKTTEGDDPSATWTNDLTLSPKRRRLDNGEDRFPPERHVFKPPQTPASDFAKAASRAPPAATQDSIATHAFDTTPNRPAFLRSSIAPPEPSEPLPDAFSPHRHGQKHVPGGMAATMQQWVREAGQTAVQSRRGQGYLRGEDYVMRVKVVEEDGGGGPHLVKARTSEGEAVNLILTGKAPTGSARHTEPTADCLVGIRAPSWSIKLGGTEYVVAVDWRILQ